MKYCLTFFLALFFILPAFAQVQQRASIADNNPQPLPFIQDWSDSNIIQTNDDWSLVLGITGYRGDDIVASTGASPETLLTEGTVTIDVIANSSNPNTLISGGVAEFSGLADPTVALQGSGTADAPNLLISLNTTGASNITVSYKIRDIDGSADNSIQSVALQYRIGSSGNFTNISAAFIADATTGPSLATLVTPVSVTLPASAENQSLVQLRIITSNAVGNDEWVGIDDIDVRSIGPVNNPGFSMAPTIINFGSLLVGSTHTDTVTVTNTGTAALSITDAQSDDNQFSITPTSATIAPGNNEMFLVSFTPTSAGPKSTTIKFSHNAPAGGDTLYVSGTGLAGVFSLSPAGIDFGHLLVGSTHVDSVTVTNGGSSDLTISNVSSDYGAFAIYPTNAIIGPSLSMKFAVSFSPTTTGFTTGNITFTHDGPSSPDVLPVSGTGIDVTFTVNPTTLNFGSLLVGDVHTDTVTVTNGGTGLLTISSVTSHHPEYSVSPASGSVPGGGSLKFAITFAPTSEGSKPCDIIFEHNAYTSPDTVWVNGSASSPSSILTIAAARALPNGDTVTVQGILTRAYGAFSRIQDSTGALSIRQTLGSYFDSLTNGGLRPGDLVEITGKTSEFNGLKQINAADLYSWQRISRDNPLPTPQVVTLADIVNGGEQYESELIRIEGLQITGSGNFNAATTYPVADPSDVSGAVTLRTPNAADGEVDGTPIPTGPVRYTGVLGQFSSSNPTGGYQLLAVLVADFDFSTTVPNEGFVPKEFALAQNYPNPFNPSTRIVFDVAKETKVTLTVYNMLGQKMLDILNDAEYSVGRHEVTLNASSMATGLYFYRLSTPEFTSVKKMVLMK